MIDLLANEQFLMLVAVWMVAAVGMNLVYVTGQLNLGQAGFLAVGAYTCAVIDATWGWPLPWSLLAGAVAAGLVAVPVAVGANRVRGVYLVMGTLAVGEVVRVTISTIDAVGGLQGYSGQSRPSGVAVAATLAVVLAVATVVMASPFGLTMRSIFDDEDAAAAAGVSTRRVKIAAVVISAAVVGVAGGLYAGFFQFIAPRDFGVAVSFAIALYTLIGGTHSLVGALVGAFGVTYLLRLLANIEDITWVPDSLAFLAGWRVVVYGVLVMVLMAILPEGLISRRTGLRLTAPVRAGLRRLRTPDRSRRAAAEAPAAPPGDGPVLEIDAVSHRFGGVQALDSVGFSVHAGEVLALVGANGAGKSTLIDVVAGRHRRQDGRVLLDGRDVSRWRPEARVRAGIMRTFQTVRSFGHLTVEEVIRLGRRTGGARRRLGVDEVLVLIELDGRRDQLPDRLSLGDQRRLEIGRALAGAPRVLLLDEPSVGMNDAERTELSALIEGIARDGTAVVLVDHNLDLVFAIADRAVVLDFGRVIATGAPDAVAADPRVREAYLGHAGTPLATAGEP